MTLAELAAYLDSDPAVDSIEPGVSWRDGNAALYATYLNEPAGKTVLKSSYPANEIFSAIKVEDFLAVQADRREYLSLLLSRETIEVTPDVFTALTTQGGSAPIWGTTANQGSHTAILALLQRTDGSIAEEQWGEGVVVSASQVAAAANV